MKHNDDGRIAEEKVVEYLRANGYFIVDKNWKTARCEIDIVAKKDGCVHFVEVKYRTTHSQGDGFSYITDSKLKQMAFAAEIWVSKNKWDGEYVLSGASVSGPEYHVAFIEAI